LGLTSSLWKYYKGDWGVVLAYQIAGTEEIARSNFQLVRSGISGITTDHNIRRFRTPLI
jgi:hypothetical protein